MGHTTVHSMVLWSVEVQIEVFQCFFICQVRRWNCFSAILCPWDMVRAATASVAEVGGWGMGSCGDDMVWLTHNRLSMFLRLVFILVGESGYSRSLALRGAQRPLWWHDLNDCMEYITHFVIYTYCEWEWTRWYIRPCIHTWIYIATMEVAV